MTQISDTLAPSDPDSDGSTSAQVTITTTYTTTDYNGNVRPHEVTHTVVVKNPCVDPSFVWLVAPALPPVTYIVDFGPFSWGPHLDFQIETSPVLNHDLCGEVTLVAKYDGSPTSLSPAVDYDSATKEFTVNTSDRTLVDQEKPYSLHAELTSWPKNQHSTASTATATNKISYISPCRKPFAFTAVNQDNAQPDGYSGQPIDWQFKPFTVAPDWCPVTYTCTDVKRVDGAPLVKLACSDIAFDSATGAIGFTATEDDYKNDRYRPGQYQITITGTVDGSDPASQDTTTFILELEDLCDPPASFTSTGWENQEYTLTGLAETYTHPAFVIQPDYCRFELEYDISKLADGASALT